MTQPRLIDAPLVGLYPIPLAEANDYLVRWGHRLGPVNRPFRSEAFALEVDDGPVAVAVSASTVSRRVAGWDRGEVVELARLGACEPWANRVLLRLWREVCAPLWQGWEVRAAVSYSVNAMHRGDLYRFDGWTRVTDRAGSGGGGSWSKRRLTDDPVAGRKTLWVWEYARD